MSKVKKQTKKKLKLKKKSILFILLLFIFLFSTYQITSFFLDAHQNEEETKSVVEEATKIEIQVDEEGNEQEVFTVDFDKLTNTNSDTIGWIRTNGGNISYPVVHTIDNEYYLSHSFNKKNNKLGAIFMDYRNTNWDNKNVVVFGHNASDKSMFGLLRNVFNKDYFDDEKNHYIEIITKDNKTYKYEIFSYYAIEAEEYYITTDFQTDSEFLEFLNNMKKRSYKNFGLSLKASDRIITLSTCNGSGNTNRRTVIHAKLVEEN